MKIKTPKKVGRKPVPSHLQRKSVTLTLPPALIAQLKQENANISRYIEALLNKELGNV